MPKSTFYSLYRSITELICRLNKYKSGVNVPAEADRTEKTDLASNIGVKTVNSGNPMELRQLSIAREEKAGTSAL